MLTWLMIRYRAGRACARGHRVAWRSAAGAFRGGSMELTTDVPDLKRVNGSCSEGFNDCVSSIRVQRQ